MIEEEFQKVHNLFAQAIQGGCSENMTNILDAAIDEGDLSEDFCRKYEMEICNIFDDGWFTCNQCSWTMPISEMADNDDWICTDCD